MIRQQTLKAIRTRAMNRSGLVFGSRTISEFARCSVQRADSMPISSATRRTRSHLAERRIKVRRKKLSVDQIAAIRRALDRGPMTKEIGTRFGGSRNDPKSFAWRIAK